MPKDSPPRATHIRMPTANSNPPKTDQQGIKGMDPKSETGTQAESEAPEGPN